MYILYCTMCLEKNYKSVKQSMYRKIYLSKFNIGFDQPKSDRCDLCETFKVSKKENLMTEILQSQYDEHNNFKSEMRRERRKDKDGKTPVLCFDLENVLTCPRAEISSFYYRRKLKVNNLTAHLSTTKMV